MQLSSSVQERPDMLRQLFGCALHEKISLQKAAEILGASREELKEAVMYRMAVADKGTHYELDYFKQIEEGVRRLMCAN